MSPPKWRRGTSRTAFYLIRHRVIDEAGLSNSYRLLKKEKGGGALRYRGGSGQNCPHTPKTVSSDDKELLAKLEGNLKMTVFGQDDAVTQMVSAIKLARAGLRAARNPLGVFIGWADGRG
ncbi:MAG: hypothetical protein CM15mP84_08270 [Cellvibrionales bacterium]|nr:MAG: hypothetical protein CM15mP84_08270 [Cellvibrionales bacterium]